MVTYHVGSLFDAPKDALIGHSCNCRGRWGSGIAKEFAERFPSQYRAYVNICDANRDNLRGRAAVIPSESHQVVCLFTSRGYGATVDSVPDIVEATREALRDLTKQLPEHSVIHLPKINSGLFGVPWELTELELKVQRYFDFEIWVPS